MEKDQLQAEEIQHYLRTRVMPILEPLQMNVLKSRPSNINEFCLSWLQSYSTLALDVFRRKRKKDDRPDRRRRRARLNFQSQSQTEAQQE